VACAEPLRRGTRRLALLALLAGLPALALAADESWVAPLAAHSLLLDVAAQGSKRVAVGARGHIMVSDDSGASWRQSAHVPTQALLTAVALLDERHGWAVGHDEVILRTSDGGETWTKVHESLQAQRPLLDVWFADARRGIAIGAYAAYYTTDDGGATWREQAFVDAAAPPPSEDELPPDYHLNRIAAVGSHLFIAGEAGHVYRSDDQGATWRSMALPYDGSMYGLLPLGDESLLVFGLRGNLFRSTNAGASWTPIETGTVAMLTAGVRIDERMLAIVGLAGTVLVSRDGGASFTLQQREDRKGLSGVVAAGPAALLAVGEGGIEQVTLQ